ncbi:MAG: ABC transporter permease subunit, partial [Chloroflexota bacterium]|nr:ABC transporter permease subunit [Chloroflexota bacterium]
MARVAAATSPADLVAERARADAAPRGYVAATWHRLRRDHLSMAALALLVAIILLATVGPWVAQAALGVDPYRQTLSLRQQAPSPAHPFGTDDLGRDMLARTLAAGRVSLTIGVTIALVSLMIGIPVGLASGYYGGRFDDVSNAVIQTLANIPSMFLLVLLSALLNPEIILLGVIIGLLGWMGTARMIRGMTFS